MLCVSGDNQINAGPLCAGDHDGVFVIIVFDAEGILAVFTEGIHDAKEGEDAGDNFSDFAINVFFTLELLLGKEMDIGYFLGGDESVNLFICDSKEDFFSVIKPRASFLKDVQNDVCIKQNFHAS